jgi:hypothetical protein
MTTRPLTPAQAKACETATGGRCRCQCGGQMHGARRTTDPWTLPDSDPHFAVPRWGAQLALPLPTPDTGRAAPSTEGA